MSLWTWPTHHRSDASLTGLLEAGQRELGIVLGELEGAFGPDDFYSRPVEAWVHVR
jgi:hypothetical protein